MKLLTPREKKILEMRYGIIDGIAYSYEEVARFLNMPVEEIKRLEKLVFKRLRVNARNRTP